MIDLAGSEKVATDIERRKEGGYINRSLLTLGHVISKITSDEPYVIKEYTSISIDMANTFFFI